MHFTSALLTIATIITGVTAAPSSLDGLGALPSCATTCAIGGVQKTSCAMTDFKCICSDTAFLESIQSCVVDACDASQQQATLNVASSLCGAAGVTITATVAAPTGTAAGDAASSTPTAMQQGNGAGRNGV